MLLSLPYPPAANNLFRNVPGRGRVKTDAYSAWLAEALIALRGQRAPKHPGSFRATILLTRPDRRRRDIDNLVKGVMDALTKAGVIEDAHLAQSIHLAWAWDQITPGGAVSVAIEPAEFPIFLLGRAA